jgi:release factor glutamine methyltransferase
VRYRDLYTLALRRIWDQEKALDIQILIEKAFQLSRTRFWIDMDQPIGNLTHLRRFYRYLNRLIQHEPLAYILKEKEFFSESFFVNKNVLIPRPETEVLVERSLELIRQPTDICDIGAGSGSIAVILAKKTGSKVWAVESSPEALYVLKKNIHRHRLKGRVIACRADLFPEKKRLFDLIVSNPPYLSLQEWQELPAHIKNHEPKGALLAGERGSEILEQIIRRSPQYLKPGGSILLEIGFGQQAEVNRLLRQSGFQNIRFFEDYSRIPRVAVGQQSL